MENNTFKILGILMIFVILSVDFVLVNAIVEDSPLSFVTHYDEKFGYGFNPPDGWEITESPVKRSGIIIIPKNMGNNSFFVHMWKVTYAEPEMKYSIIDSFEEFCNTSFSRYYYEIDNVHSKTRVYENKPFVINGYDAFDYQYSYNKLVKDVGIVTTTNTIYFVQKDKYNRLVIEMVGTESGYDVYLDEFINCLNTLEFR